MPGKFRNPSSISEITLGLEEPTETIKVKLLGKGTGGWVYLDLDSEPPNQRLFKLTDLPETQDEESSFERECEGTELLFQMEPGSLIRHQGTITITDVDGSEEVNFTGYFMPFIPSNGIILSQRTNDGQLGDPGLQDLPLYQRLQIVLDLAEQIKSVHDADALVTDLKPDNIIINTFGVPPKAQLIDGGGVIKIEDIIAEVRKRHISTQQTDVEDPLDPGPEPVNNLGGSGKIKYNKALKKWRRDVRLWKEANGFNKDWSYQQCKEALRERRGVEQQDTFIEKLEDGTRVIHGIIGGVDFECTPEYLSPDSTLSLHESRGGLLYHGRRDEPDGSAISKTDRRAISKKSDVHTLAKMLFLLLGGDPHIAMGHAPTAGVAAVSSEKEFYPAIEALFPIPPQSEMTTDQQRLRSLLLSALRDDYSKRPTIEFFLKDLRELLHSQENVSSIVESTTMNLSEKVDWLLSFLPKPEQQANILEALKRQDVQQQIINTPRQFYGFFKTIQHLKSLGQDLSNDATVKKIISAGLKKPENKKVALKALCVIASMGLEVDPKLVSSLGLSESMLSSNLLDILKSFAVKGEYISINTLYSSSFFKAHVELLPIDTLLDKEFLRQGTLAAFFSACSPAYLETIWQKFGPRLSLLMTELVTPKVFAALNRAQIRVLLRNDLFLAKAKKTDVIINIIKTANQDVLNELCASQLGEYLKNSWHQILSAKPFKEEVAAFLNAAITKDIINADNISNVLASADPSTIGSLLTFAIKENVVNADNIANVLASADPSTIGNLLTIAIKENVVNADNLLDILISANPSTHKNMFTNSEMIQLIEAQGDKVVFINKLAKHFTQGFDSESPSTRTMSQQLKLTRALLRAELIDWPQTEEQQIEFMASAPVHLRHYFIGTEIAKVKGREEAQELESRQNDFFINMLKSCPTTISSMVRHSAMKVTLVRIAKKREELDKCEVEDKDLIAKTLIETLPPSELIKVVKSSQDMQKSLAHIAKTPSQLEKYGKKEKHLIAKTLIETLPPSELIEVVKSSQEMKKIITNDVKMLAYCRSKMELKDWITLFPKDSRQKSIYAFLASNKNTLLTGGKKGHSARLKEAVKSEEADVPMDVQDSQLDTTELEGALEQLNSSFGSFGFSFHRAAPLLQAYALVLYVALDKVARQTTVETHVDKALSDHSALPTVPPIRS